MFTIETAVTIASRPERVWEIIVNFDGYREWNPFILWAEGDPSVGSTIKAHIRPPGGKGMTHQPTVTIAEPPRHLQWLGRLAVPGLFAARHEFVLQPLAEGTRLRHREEFNGLLVPFLRRTLRRTEAGFHALNQALKQRAEQRSG